MIRRLASNILSFKDLVSAKQPSLLAQFAGLLLVIPVLLLDSVSDSWSQYPTPPLELMAIMSVALLLGAWMAVGVVLLTSINVVFFGESWIEWGQMLGAVLAAELLRRGVRPHVVTALLLLSTLGASMLLEPLALVSVTTGFLHASTAVAAAALTMLLMPRRSPHFPTRCRIQWELILFVLIVGMTSIAAYALTPHDPNSPRLFALMLLAHLTAFGVGTALNRLVRDPNGPVSQWLLQHVPASSRHRSRSLDIAAPLLPVVRQTRRLKRIADREARQLAATRKQLQRQERELQECLRALRESTQMLQSTTEKYDALRARWRALVEQASDVMLVTDARGRIVFANRAVVRLLGMDLAELAGTSIESLIPPSHLISHPLNLTAHQDEERERSGQAPVRCARGKERELTIRVKRLSVANTTEYAIQLRNVDHKKQALTALKRARMAVDNARRSRNAFNAAMSHELRTPLHGLISTLDMLRDESLSPAGTQRLAIARASTRSLLKIANDILDLSRMDGGDFALEHRSFSLTRLLQEAVEEARAQANSRGLHLATQIHGDFPAALVGDGQRIRQIVVNLISNAMKFTHRGGVRVEARFDGQQCTIDVIDSGQGIPEDKREAIFAPFVQAHASAKHLGAGLGLSICRRLSVAMGGNLILLKTGPKGSTFRLRLPLEASNEAPPEETSLRIFNNPRGRILVVEDHPVNQYVVKSMLDVLTCPATIAGSGPEAIELIQQQQEFDLILMDCEMPGMDGLETTRRVRKLLTRHVPIIAMTANAMLEDRQRCLDAGMDDFLAKPFGRSNLNDMLCKWLDPEKTRQDGRAATAEPLAKAIKKVPAVDREIVEDLWRNLKWQLPPMRRIGETFLSSVHDTEKMFDAPQSSTMRRQIHTLLGTAGMIGARQIERIAAEMQKVVKERRWDDLQEIRTLFQKAAWEFEREFNRLLSSPPGLSETQLDISEID